MITVLAHAGHWLVQLAYLAPLVILVGLLVANRLRERRERRAQEAAAVQRREGRPVDGSDAATAGRSDLAAGARERDG